MKRLLGTWVVVALGEVVLLVAGRAGAPAVGSTDEAVFALLRLIGLALGAYLLVVLTVGAALRALELAALVRWSDVFTPRWVRSALDRSLGVMTAGAMAMAVTVGPAAAASADQGPPITLRGLRGPVRSAEPTTTTTVPVPPPELLVKEPVVRTVEPVAELPPVSLPPPVAVPVPSAASPVRPSAPRSPSLVYEPAAPTPAGRTWQVQRGDHFWSIAQRVLAEARSRPVAAHEVAPYWRALVADNRSRLADPDNPDLLFAGQVLTVPSVNSPPG